MRSTQSSSTKPLSAHRVAGLLAVLASAALCAALATSAPASARTADRATSATSPAAAWAPAGSAKITPGVMMYTAGAQCTANFVYTDAAHHVYVGYAAHCAGTGSATDTNGCQTTSLPLGTKVTFSTGGSLLGSGSRVGSGKLAYSSWLTEKELGTRAPYICAYNDLALVRVAARDVRKVNPSVPFWGGPTGLDTDGTSVGDRVYSYGNSSLRAGLAPLAPRTGISLSGPSSEGGWSHQLYTVSPGIPGDSGSGFVSADGKAIGVLSTLGIAPLPLSNNIGDLAKELAFARKHSGIDGLRLVRGTVRFSPIL